MRGIPEERLRELIENDDYYDSGIEKSVIYGLIANECQELNPWLTLEEFLKSGFEGECWICTREKEIIKCNFNGVVFSHGRRRIIPVTFVTHVQPIHKPEPPR